MMEERKLVYSPGVLEACGSIRALTGTNGTVGSPDEGDMEDVGDLFTVDVDA